MEIKVRDLGQVEGKSTQQVEEELLKKHEESLNDDSPKEEVSNEEAPVVESEVKEEVQEEPQETARGARRRIAMHEPRAASS